ncbi:MAG: FAD-dependent oxidoreductase [Thermoleophilia bacterium]
MGGTGSLSLWHDTCGDDLEPRPPLGGDLDVDVAIVGAGYTGLWTAYYLKKADPALRVCLLEKEIAGFGASGRNGGWCSQLFATPREKLAEAGGREGAVALQKVMFATVAEVGNVAEDEGIACDYHRGGNLVFATRPAHLARLKAELEYERSWGFGEEDYRWLTPAEASDRIAVRPCYGALYSPHCARVHPAKLARGLARVVERLGVPIYEETPVTAIEAAAGFGGAAATGRTRIETPHGVVTAEVMVRATESFTVELPGHRRDLVPIYSLMIATEPLPDSAWRRVGWQGHETWSDGRHLLIYVCRTADGRIAIGGRGAPYHFGSRLHPEYDQDPAVAAALQQTLHELLPATRRAAVTHHWGGPVALPRDWFSSVGFDRSTGVAWAGGYVGDGVSTANLAGRTLTDLILERETELTALPWVNHCSRRWEPEPIRWLAVNATLRTLASADLAEERTGRPARRIDFMERLIGR